MLASLDWSGRDTRLSPSHSHQTAVPGLSQDRPDLCRRSENKEQQITLTSHYNHSLTDQIVFWRLGWGPIFVLQDCWLTELNCSVVTVPVWLRRDYVTLLWYTDMYMMWTRFPGPGWLVVFAFIYISVLSFILLSGWYFTLCRHLDEYDGHSLASKSSILFKWGTDCLQNVIT